MWPEWIASLEDIVEYGSKIALYTRHMSLEEFRLNELVFDAVVRNLELLGGAAKRLPGEVRAAMPEAACSRTVAFAEMIARSSVALDARVVWDLVQTKIPELVRASSATLTRLKHQ
ncbi:MAG TPA: HepT-like ribonuclease domain-containing protein [Steroidobacteraceae bacterium]|nr:HepT-like ribonuclease domain-containing protein [Steroidobacteraceae bacterium]